MANANLVQRTFTKVIYLGDATSLNFSCVDSSGNSIKCNYIAAQISPSAANSPVGNVIFSPLVGSINQASSIGVTNLSSTASTSGAVGFSISNKNATIASPIYEYICLGNENFSVIQLLTMGCNNGAVITLTYGVVQELPTLRASDRYLYNKGL
jgi:hypothetical protein